MSRSSAARASKLLTHRLRLDEADAVYRLFDTQTTGKGVLVF